MTFGQDVPVVGEVTRTVIPADYSFAKFEEDMSKIEPRFFDKYILPGFMLWFAVRSKASMGRWPRRMLFTAGVYMFYRNYKHVKSGIEKVVTKVNEMRAGLPPESQV